MFGRKSDIQEVGLGEVLEIFSVGWVDLRAISFFKCNIEFKMYRLGAQKIEFQW